MKNNELASLYHSPSKNEVYYYQSIADLNKFMLKEVVSAILSDTSLNIIIDDNESVALDLQSVFHIKGDAYVIPPVFDKEVANIDHSLIAQLSTIQQTNSKIYSTILGQLTVVDIIKLLSDIAEEVTPYPFVISENNFEFTPSEFYDLKQSISKFIEYSRYHNQDGLRARILSTYNTHTIKSRELSELHQSVRQWYSELNDIKKSLLSGLNEIEKVKIANEIEEYHKTKRKFELLKTQIATFIEHYGMANVEKPSLLSLSANKKERFKAWQDIHNQHEYLELDVNPEEAYIKVSKSVVTLDSLFFEHKKTISSSLKSVNDLNTDNRNIKHASNQLGKLIQNINSNQIFLETQECNATSINKKLDFIDQIKYKLEIFLQCNNIQSVIEWHEELEKLDPSFIKFLDQLKSCTIDEWRYQFEYYYLKEALKKHNTELLYDQKMDISNFLNEIDQKMEDLQKTIIGQYNNTLQRRMDELKSKNKSLYKSLKSATLLSSELEEVLHDMPFIRIITAQSIENKKDDYSKDKTIFISNSNEKIGIQTNLKLVRSEVYTLFLIPTEIKIINNLKDTNITLQLNIAKGLAYNLFPYLNIVRAYQTKKGNIISLVDAHWQDDIADSLYQFGSKEFRIENPDHLTDFLLSTDRPLFIITQDGLLNPKEFEIIDQLLIMSQCLKAGITFINISSILLLENPTNQIQHVIQKLGFEFPTIAENKESVI